MTRIAWIVGLLAVVALSMLAGGTLYAQISSNRGPEAWATVEECVDAAEPYAPRLVRYRLQTVCRAEIETYQEVPERVRPIVRQAVQGSTVRSQPDTSFIERRIQSLESQRMFGGDTYDLERRIQSLESQRMFGQ